jgi:hypothetical protein
MFVRHEFACVGTIAKESSMPAPATSSTLLPSAPRPASGDGDVILDLGQTRVRFSWNGGELTDVTTSMNDSFVLADEEMLPNDFGTAGVVTCRKCAKDSTTGQEVCWDVPC